MVQLQRNPPENEERRWRVAERKYQHVCVHEELQLWELGDVFGVMETLPQRRCPGPSRCPPLLGALWEGWLCAQSWVSQNQQEKAGDVFCSDVVQGTGWSIPHWDKFLVWAKGSPRMPGTVSPLYPPGFIPFFQSFLRYSCFIFLAWLSPYNFCGFFSPPDLDSSSPHVCVPLLCGLSDLSRWDG